MRLRHAPPRPSPFAVRLMTFEMRAYATIFAQLVAAENAPNLRPRQFAAISIRRDYIRGHDEIVFEQMIASAGVPIAPRTSTRRMHKYYKRSNQVRRPVANVA